jgi:signal transduction histidine kinase
VRTRAVGDQVEVSIRDNGNGVPEAIRSKIFEPFFTTKPTGLGNTGLGLSLSFDIVVQEHHGELSLKSVEGEYAEFIIRLPRS